MLFFKGEKGTSTALHNFHVFNTNNGGKKSEEKQLTNSS